MWIARLVVALAIIASVYFNGSYAHSRGSTALQAWSLVLAAVIIDLAKTSFLAAADDLRRQRHRLAALLLLVLWVPLFALSTWSGYAYIATSRHQASAVAVASSEVRDRTRQRYDDTRRAIALATTSDLYTQSAACTRLSSKAVREFCERLARAKAELGPLEAQLAALPAARPDPEAYQLAKVLGVEQAVIEFWIAVLPALMVELVASLGFYAVTRPVNVSGTQTKQERVWMRFAWPKVPRPRSTAPTTSAAAVVAAAPVVTPAVKAGRAAVEWPKA